MSKVPASAVTLSLLQKAHRAPLTAAALRELAAELAGVDDVHALIDEAADQPDAEAVALLMLAASTAGVPPTCTQAARVLPRVANPQLFTVLVGATVGDKVTMLLDLVERGQMTIRCDGIALFCCAEILADAPPPPALLTQIRLVGRSCGDPVAHLLLGVAAERLGDENTIQALGGPVPEFAAKSATVVADDVRRSLVGPPVEVLPNRAPLRTVSGFTVRRPAEKISRNAPCPCGSGKKYKKCCQKADEARLSDPSPVAGLTMPEYLAQAGRHMSIEEFIELQPHQLLEMDLESLPSIHLILALNKLSAHAFWDEAVDALDLLATRTDLPFELDEYRAPVIGIALEARATDVALLVASKLDNPAALYEPYQLGLMLAADESRILAELETLATTSLEPTSTDPCVIPAALFPMYPALGLLAARGSIDPERNLDSVTLLEEIERARDRLQLPPGDPFGDYYDLIAGHYFDELDAEAATQALATQNQELTAELAKLRERLMSASARSREAERELHAAKDRLDAAESATKAARAKGTEHKAGDTPADTKALQRKVDDLKSLLRDGNEERRTLRRQLAGARERLHTSPEPSAASDGHAIQSSDDGLETALDSRVHAGVLLPVFDDRARVAIQDAPLRLARAAVQTAGSLAAGTEHAWRGVKQLRTAHGVFSARLGIHYRLLFKLNSESGQLVVLDLIHRRDLEASVTRYR